MHSQLQKIFHLLKAHSEEEIQQLFENLAKDHHLPRYHPEDPIPAAVLIPIVNDIKNPRLLLTVRTSHLQHHPGQISFPGGRIDQCDLDPKTCMLREVKEEIGLDPKQIHILGHLGKWPSFSGYLVTPFVGLIEPPITIVPSPDEVAEVFEIPFSMVFDSKRYKKIVIKEPIPHQYYEMMYKDKRIWGFTASILALLSYYLN